MLHLPREALTLRLLSSLFPRLGYLQGEHLLVCLLHALKLVITLLAHLGELLLVALLQMLGIFFNLCLK